MQAETTVSPPHRLGFLATLRKDTWWLEPATIAVALLCLFGYLTVAAFLDGWKWEIGPYLSPLYEPKLSGKISAWWFSPALIILWVPIGFRATCYYYRRAYYRSWFAQPAACAVGDLGRKYEGEAKFPFVLQNLHRFFLYGALVFNVFLWVGAIKAFHDSNEGWGIGLGSVILVVNAFLLMMYSFSCHSFRHLIGGRLDCFSCSAVARTRKHIWDRVSAWNEYHRQFAWASLLWITFTDVYIRLVANGTITDPHTWKW